MPRRILPLLLVLLALGVAACGDDESGDESGGGGGGADPAARETATQAAAEGALRDTRVRPVLPKPTGSPPRRLVTQDVVEGTGPAARTGDTVLMHFVGMNFSNGAEFDASWSSGEPFPVQLGAGGVIEGWERGLVGIRKGGRRILTIPPRLGYGAEGHPPAIPPNETLILAIDALEVERP